MGGVRALAGLRLVGVGQVLHLDVVVLGRGVFLEAHELQVGVRVHREVGHHAYEHEIYLGHGQEHAEHAHEVAVDGPELRDPQAHKLGVRDVFNILFSEATGLGIVFTSFPFSNIS